MLGIPKRNQPAAHDGLRAEMDRLVRENAWDGQEFSITFQRKYSARRAALGWLRAAYLASFAAFGYKYIISTELEPVREQLANSDCNLLENFHVLIRSAPCDDRRLIVIKEPAELRDGLAVQMGVHLVLLPSPSTGADFYTRVDEQAGLNRPAQLRSGALIPWPTRPEHVLDFR
ncbi:MAG: hypothetical protein HYX92_09745 [Chloroflexi bacterium]|nr:hypothetical protein [Chloroflexota bacterium]